MISDIILILGFLLANILSRLSLIVPSNVFSTGKTPNVSGFCSTYSTTCLILFKGVVKQFMLYIEQNSSTAIALKLVAGSKYAIFFTDSKLDICTSFLFLLQLYQNK